MKGVVATGFHLFQELLFTLFVDDGVGVAHHGDQHVEEENGNQDLKENEHCLRHAGINALAEFVVLKI